MREHLRAALARRKDAKDLMQQHLETLASPDSAGRLRRASRRHCHHLHLQGKTRTLEHRLLLARREIPADGGVVLGATDRYAGEATERPIHYQDVIATLYHQLGIDSATTLTDPTGRPQFLVDTNYKPLPEVI